MFSFSSLHLASRVRNRFAILADATQHNFEKKDGRGIISSIASKTKSAAECAKPDEQNQEHETRQTAHEQQKVQHEATKATERHQSQQHQQHTEADTPSSKHDRRHSAADALNT